MKKDADIVATGVKVAIAVVIVIALSPLIGVATEILISTVTFLVSLLFIMISLAAIVCCCGYLFEEVKDRMPDKVRNRVKGIYDDAKGYFTKGK